MTYVHPTLENERKTLEVLAAVIGGENLEVADGQIEESADVVSPVSENKIAVDFKIELY